MKQLNIVCFGDSLTLGYQSPTSRTSFVENIPYGDYVQEWLGIRGQVVTYGVCGETTQDMRLRFQRDVLNPSPHVAIILGGTNDLGCGIHPEVIMENLMFFYEQAHAQKVTPVAVTVPSLRDDSGQGYSDETSQSGQGLTGAVEQAIALRLMLNQSIKELGHAQQFPVVDWFTATCESPAQALAAEFSNDGLHLNTAGYRKLAELVCSQVLEDLLSKQN